MAENAAFSSPVPQNSGVLKPAPGVAAFVVGEEFSSTGVLPMAVGGGSMPRLYGESGPMAQVQRVRW